jgi:hypothetical protein
MRTLAAISLFMALPACAPGEAPLEAEARAWIARTYREVETDSLEIRNVRRAGEVTCGEASFEANGRPSGNRLFLYRKDGSGTLDVPREPLVLPDGAHCPVSDEILSVCGRTPEERQQAELRHLRCSIKSSP